MPFGLQARGRVDSCPRQEFGRFSCCGLVFQKLSPAEVRLHLVMIGSAYGRDVQGVGPALVRMVWPGKPYRVRVMITK